MYDYYQVKEIHFEYLPFRFQGRVNTGTATDQLTVFNTFTIIDPDNIFPVSGAAYSESFMYSFGNCKSELPYSRHSRGFKDWTNLGISKQDKLIR